MNAYFFKPIYQERIWGGHHLAELFGRTLPEGKKIGESWELVDRPEACSEIESGPGIAPGTHQNIHTLWQDKRVDVFGTRAPDLARFPILIKVLDCQDNLSVQVHPPPGHEGEPKTEMWYFLESTPEAKIYAGLKNGVTREGFEKAIGTPELPKLLSDLHPQQSDATSSWKSSRIPTPPTASMTGAASMNTAGLARCTGSRHSPRFASTISSRSSSNRMASASCNVRSSAWSAPSFIRASIASGTATKAVSNFTSWPRANSRSKIAR
jgi:mannose-6-phosphate isomerase class I